MGSGLTHLSLALAVAVACSEGGPGDPGSSQLSVQSESGSGQIGLPGTPLPDPLVVRVRTLDDGSVRPGVRVDWELIEGAGAGFSPATSLTDADGRASTRVTLGGRPGPYRVRAGAPDGASVEFTVTARAVPVIRDLSPALVTAGAGLEIRGFALAPGAGAQGGPGAADVIVEIAGLRSVVQSASDTLVRVVVPACLPDARVPVRVRSGPAVSAAAALTVVAAGPAPELVPGVAHRIDDPEAVGCVRLRVAASSEVLILARSSNIVAGTRVDYGLSVVLSGEDATGRSAPTQARTPQHVRGPANHVRAAQGTIAGGTKLDSRTAFVASGARSPVLGEQVDFLVPDFAGGFETVRATARALAPGVAVFVDQATPDGGLTDADLEALATGFSDPVLPVLTGAFGAVPDTDGDQVVRVLLTPRVNALSSVADSGRVGGFFWEGDLTAGATGNEGEVLYALVPDPEGSAGPPVTVPEARAGLPAVLAHELQHLIHFGVRRLGLGAPPESLWLSEALAQAAEDLVADTLDARGRASEALLYRSGNDRRARAFLADPASTSLIIRQGAGSRAERGSGWLFLTYLRGQVGPGLLRALTGSTDTGVDNVAALSGLTWPELLDGWGAALVLDESPLVLPPSLRFGDFDLAGRLYGPGGRVPVRSFEAAVGLLETDRIAASSVAHRVLRFPGGGEFAIGLTGVDGQPLPEVGGVALTVVRAR